MSSLSYISDTDGNNKVCFDYTPICSRYPKFDADVFEYKCMPYHSDTTPPVPQKIESSFLNFGGNYKGGKVVLSHNCMEIETFEDFKDKYVTTPPQEHYLYDAVSGFTYHVIWRRFDYDFITGTTITNWSMEFSILDIISEP